MLDDVLRHNTTSNSNDLYSVAKFLARTKSRLIAVALEDLLGVVDQPNIPGTIDEHPNWRQRMPVALEEIAGAIDIDCVEAGHHERTRTRSLTCPRQVNRR